MANTIIFYNSMKELITIHVGNAGMNIGDALWSILAPEHEIQSDGLAGEKLNGNVGCMFQECKSGQYLPRCLFTDIGLEDGNTIKKHSQNKSLYNQRNFFLKEESSIGIHTRAKSLAKSNGDQMMEIIRQKIECCDSPQAIMFTNSLAGGTGPGLTDFLSQMIKKEFGKIELVSASILPAKNLILEYHNFFLSTEYIKDYQDACFWFDNASLHKYCSDVLDIEQPSYAEVNQVVAQQLSNLTSLMRFEGNNVDTMQKLLTNLVPFQKFKYISSSLSALSPLETETIGSNESILMKSLFSPNNDLSGFNLLAGYGLSSEAVFRGDLKYRSIQEAVAIQKRNNIYKYLDCAPNKIGSTLSWKIPHSASIFKDHTDYQSSNLTNSTAVCSYFDKMCDQFGQLYAKRAFRCWYFMEGCEESDMCNALQEIEDLRKEYRETEKNRLEEPGI